MLGCEVLFGKERGREVRQMVERVIDGPCPCSRDRECPLIPPRQREDGDALTPLS